MASAEWYNECMGVDGWMNLQEAARELGIKNPSQLRKLIAKKQLTAEKPGGHDWMVRVEEVERYKADRRPPGYPKGRPRKQEPNQSSQEDAL